MVDHKYLVHGLCMESNVDFPEFTAFSCGSPDITLLREEIGPADTGSMPDAQFLLKGQYLDQNGGTESFTHHGFPEHYVLTLDGLCEFQIARDGSRVSCRPWAGVLWSDIKPFLVGRILSLALNLRGTLTLHGGAVGLPQGAIALTAMSGTGKSTMLTTLACMGLRLISDDLLAVGVSESDIHVEPGPSQVRLTGESLGFLESKLPANSQVRPDFDKMKVFLHEDAIPSEPLPLLGVYLLNRRLEEDGGVGIETLTPREALGALAGNMANLALMERPQFTKQFSSIARLVDRVPVKTFSYPSGIGNLPEVCRALLEDQGLETERKATGTPRTSP